jgi:hypothetical protein
MWSDDLTKRMNEAAGLDCPAAQPLCLCGQRGCPQAALHSRTMPSRKGGKSRWRRP